MCNKDTYYKGFSRIDMGFMVSLSGTVSRGQPRTIPWNKKSKGHLKKPNMETRTHVH